MSPYRCSKCPARLDAQLAFCPACHAAEVARIHRHDSPESPPVPDLVPYVPPAERRVRPHANGRRVFRHEQAQS